MIYWCIITLRFTSVEFWWTQYAVSDRRKPRFPMVGQVLRRSRRRADDHWNSITYPLFILSKLYILVYSILHHNIILYFIYIISVFWIYCGSEMKVLRLLLALRGARATGEQVPSTSCLCPTFGCVQKCNCRVGKSMSSLTAGFCGDCGNDSLSYLT